MMAVPIFLAKIFAILYLCAGLGALLNKKHFRKVLEQFNKDAGLDYFGGMMALVLGFLMMSSYNVWVWNWTLLITLMGWGVLLKGAFHLIFPEASMRMTEKMLVKTSLVAMLPAICIILGLIFGYFGFFTS